MWVHLKQKIWQWRGVLIAAPGIAGLIIGARAIGLLQPLELAALDQLFLLRPQESVDPRIVIVEVNEADVQYVKGWPMTDAMLARLLTQIKAQQPAAIGLDLYRDLVHEPGHKQLVQLFETTPNLIGVQKVAGNADSAPVAPAPALKQKDQVGTNDFPLDGDGKVRRMLLYLNDPEGNTVFSFGFKLSMLYLAKQGIQPELTATNEVKLGQAIFPPFAANDGGYVQAEAGGYQVLLNYRGSIQRFQNISMRQVLENRVPAGLFRDRIVLVGATAESLKDIFYTPYSSTALAAPQRMAGVTIHANITSQILSAALEQRPSIQVWQEPIEWVWIAGWALLGAILTWSQRYSRQGGQREDGLPWAAISLTAAGGCLFMTGYGAFLGGWWIPVVPAMLALSGSALAITIYIARTASEIRRTFGRYLTDQVVASLLENPEGLKIGGDRRKITILTSDLRGFTANSERLPPEEVVKILNLYLAAMTDVITHYQGTIDEFMGDGILVLFGAPTLRPDDATRAVACALAMQQAMQGVNEKMQQAGWPPLEMGIGINTGEVVVGNIGSEKRTKYSVIGSHVNLTYRIESFTIGGQILISESTFAEVEPIVKITDRLEVHAKGVKQPIPVYEVGGLAGPYNLMLTAETETYYPLPTPLPVQYALLDGKQVGEDMFQGQLTQLSGRGAVIVTSSQEASALPSELTNIKLNLLWPDDPLLAGEDVYAKVFKQAEANSFYLHFTAKSPNLQRKLNGLYQAIALDKT